MKVITDTERYIIYVGKNEVISLQEVDDETIILKSAKEKEPKEKHPNKTNK